MELSECIEIATGGGECDVRLDGLGWLRVPKSVEKVVVWTEDGQIKATYEWKEGFGPPRPALFAGGPDQIGNLVEALEAK